MLVVCGVVGSGIVQRPFGVRCPCMIVLLLLVMLTWLAANVAVHPWSQRTPTEMSGCGLRLGNMCASQAVGGRLAKGIWVVCVDEMDSPFGSWTVMGHVV